MGEVYLAHDTKLDRKVALKVLPADVASNRDRMERFVREAKSSAALNHPNIAHIYEIGEAEVRGSSSPLVSDSGDEPTPEVVHYIAMEFIDGLTLREKIHQEQTSLPKLLRYLAQVAEGLNKAHAAGIVHRDLKPDNIMITRDDYAKVLDFGLAKLIETPFGIGGMVRSGTEDPTMALAPHLPATPSLSTPGIVMGTIGYMSPEQASGRGHELDHRSDIFSFGCILFEAATRQKAFEGKDALDSLYKIVHAPTPLLKDVNPLAPDDLQRVVRRCLAKEPDKRYQSMKEVAIEIEDLWQDLKNYTESNYNFASKTHPLSSATSTATTGEEGFRVAVLPFKYRGSNVDLEAMAEGLSDEIVTALSRFSYLRVIARSSTLRYASGTTDVRLVGKELGARYVMDGNLRVAGSTIRLTVQLVDATTGGHLWAETYDRLFRPEDIFALQDELVPRIVSTAADRHGVLPRTMSEALRNRDVEDLSPYEVLLRGYGYFERIGPSEHARLRAALERVVETAPTSDSWAMLAILYCDEHRFGFNPLPDSLGRALAAAQRGVEAAVSNSFANEALAQALFFRREFDSFRNAADRAISLNPLDGATTAFMGLLIAYAGEWDRGCEIAQRAIHINPHHPGWYWSAAFWNAYRKADYRAALSIALKFNMPGFFYHHVNLAITYGQLAEREAANKALRDLIGLKPDFALNAREELGKWVDAELLEHAIEGLRKAGLEIADAEEMKTSVPLSSPSSKTRSDEGFWVAVLPFKYSGSDADVTVLADGLSEEIVTGLSRFSYLRVIARGSTLNYANITTDLRTVGKELGARYVMEGTLRQAGTKVRLSVQLVDAISGAHLWAENYERNFSPESIFELQDDLVPRIVSTIADQHGVLPRSMSEVVRLKPADQLSPYEAVLRSFAYTERITADELEDALACLELAVQKAPSYADALAVLATLYTQDFGQGFGLRDNPLFKGESVARKAVELAPSNHLGWFGLAQVLFFQKEFQAFTQAAERSATLNSMDGNSIASLGEMLTFSGNWERGLALVERAKQLNPNHPGWYWYANFHHAYSQHDYQSALDFALRVNLPGHWASHATVAAAYGQLGQRELAAKALRDLVKLRPEASSSVLKDMAKWWTAQDVEHFIDGLRKAGLQIAGDEATYLSSDGRSQEGFWVAVLPFKSGGTNLEIKKLAEGLSEEIVTGLSRFPYLRVIDAASTASSDRDNSDLRIVGKALGARYVLEGSLRQAGSTVRVAVKLVDTTSGAHLWAETYDRTFNSESVFELQDELVPRIVSTVADQYGALVHSMSESLRHKKVGEYSPHEAVLRTFGYFERITDEEHAEVREILEAAIANSPDHSDCLAMLASIYFDEYAQGYNPRPNPLDRAYATAQRAVEAAPTNNLGHYVLALVLFFKKDFLAFRLTAERAIALNKMDASTTAYLGILLAYSGDWDRGLAIVRRAMELNPHHPGWYHFPIAYSYYRQSDYRSALENALKINMPGYVWFHVLLAAIYGQLGDEKRAAVSLRALGEVMPDFGQIARQQCSRWLDDELADHVLEGLRKAGLEIADEKRGPTTTSAESYLTTDVSSALDDKPLIAGLAVTASGSFDSLSLPVKTIAVLPFHNLSGEAEQEFFADGITEEILNALAQIPGLRVAGRSSSFSFKGRNEDLRSVGAKLNVGSILEGTLRRSGDRLRLTAQLIDTSTGYQLWSERYDRVIEDVFTVQDEIANTIAGRLQLSLSQQRREEQPPTKNIEAYELYLKGRALLYQRGLSIAKAIDCFSQAVSIDATYAQAWAGLADGYTTSGYSGFSIANEVMPRALEAARRSLELDENLAEAHNALACATLLYERNYDLARTEFKKALNLNPNYPQARAWYGLFYLQWVAGREEDAREELLRLLQIDPLSGYANVIFSFYCSSSGRSTEAVEHARRGVELDPNSYLAQWSLAVGLEADEHFEEAAAVAERALAMSGRHSWALATLGSIYGGWKQPAQANAIFAELKARREREYVQPAMVAVGAAAARNFDEAIAYAREALEVRDPLFIMIARTWPQYSALRTLPAFIEIVEQLNLPNWNRS
jgi:TolB-like protein/Tfp pilus assembly protein PilF